MKRKPNKQTMIQRNNTARLLRFSNITGSYRGCVRISAANTLAHEIKKLEVCYDLLAEGKDFITEAVFINGCRADILVLDDALAIEIVKTEKEESLIRKSTRYPVEIEVVRC